MGSMTQPLAEFRPTFGRWLTGAIWVACAVALIAAVVATGWGAALLLPWLLLLAGAVWAAFWNPRVVVDDGGVHLVNVTRTIDVPWPAVQAVDTKWALTLRTAYGSFTAWAAPAPGGVATARLSLREARSLPESSYGTGHSIRPGDHPGTASGAAALVVRRRWEELRDAGFLDDPRLEHAQVPIRWHWQILGTGAVLVVLAALTVLL
jgi:hypothetical protein